MAIEIIDGTGSGNLARVNSDGRLLVDLGGQIVISGVSIDSVVIQETSPIDDNKNNEAGSLTYVGEQVGSISAFIDASQFVKVLTYSGNVLVNVGSWVGV